MMKPAARISDMHICPLLTPGVPPVPHIGGAIIPPGAPNILIGGLPAATVGTMATCIGALDSIITGSMTVFINNKPAARMGDTCMHGGTIITGYPKVLIG
ncbi:PAAR domain-containing protein [Providencia rettgeri]|uniref:PAAR domain-containing protein n=1 Tax=Providencia rettgeri TaxID=587 RepID=UPI00326337AE